MEIRTFGKHIPQSRDDVYVHNPFILHLTASLHDMAERTPHLRWAIVGTGLISSWFVADLGLERLDAQASHDVRAVGSSSVDRGSEFVEKHLSYQETPPTVYGSYIEAYQDPHIDIVYLGIPHAFHKQACLDAVSYGKHVLCEKAFTLTASEAREVFAAAKEKGVFVMEAMWTRFFPLVKTLQKILHEDQAIGHVHRVFCDFAMDQGLPSLGPASRLKNPALGAGTLLDIGVYSLTWGLLCLDKDIGDKAQRPKIVATQSVDGGIDVGTSMLLLYSNGKQGILTSNAAVKTPRSFCRIEGSNGTIVIEGFVASAPASFTVLGAGQVEDKTYNFERQGKGFYWEADAVAVAISEGRLESDKMPWSETVRVLEMMDEVREQGGTMFVQNST